MDVVSHDVKGGGLRAKITADGKTEAKLRLTYNFLDITNQKIVHNNIRYLIGVANSTRAEELQHKRERLKKLLKEEALIYEREIICKGHEKKICIARQKEENLAAQRTQQHVDDKKFVNMKKIQQYLNNCDVIRNQLQREALIESKKCQMEQIKINEQRRAAEMEKDRLWDQVLKKMQEAQKNKEDCEKLLKQSKKMETKVELEKQILAAQRARENEKRILCDERLRRDAEYRNKDDKAQVARNRQNMLEASLRKAQLQENLVLRRKELEKEKNEEHVQNQSLHVEMERERKEIQLKMENLKQSTLQYLRYCRELRKERSKLAIAEEEVLVDIQMQIDERSGRIAREAKEKKANEAQNAHQDLLAQICENEIRRVKCAEEQRMMAMLDLKKYENDLRLDQEKQLQKQAAAMEYGRVLREQIEAIKRAEEEQKRQFAADLKKAGDEQDYCQALAKKFIEDNIAYLPTHPNWKLISCSCLNI